MPEIMLEQDIIDTIDYEIKYMELSEISHSEFLKRLAVAIEYIRGYMGRKPTNEITWDNPLKKTKF